jgi:hypothetical protein
MADAAPDGRLLEAIRLSNGPVKGGGVKGSPASNNVIGVSNISTARMQNRSKIIIYGREHDDVGAPSDKSNCVPAAY